MRDRYNLNTLPFGSDENDAGEMFFFTLARQLVSLKLCIIRHNLMVLILNSSIDSCMCFIEWVIDLLI